MFNLDLDLYLQSVDAPGWGDLAIRTDALKGRVTGLVVSGKNIQVDYYGPTGDPSCTVGCAPGQVKQITDDRAGVVTSLQSYNSLPKSVSNTLLSSGSGNAVVSWTYNNDIRIKDETVSIGGSHASTRTLGYDLDGLLTCSSLRTCDSGQGERVSITRDATSGRASAVTVGTSPTEALTYNELGELRSLVSTLISLEYEDVASSPNVPRDAQGRVKRRIERIPAGAPP